jgi:hypothetical protein
MLLKAAPIVLAAWLADVLGLYDAGSLLHILLLVGLMMLLLGVLKGHDAAAIEAAQSRPVGRGTSDMKPPEERARKWNSGAPWWWFGAPLLAFGYVLLTPRFLPDIVSVPSEMAGAQPSVRWLVGVVLGVAVLVTIRFARWVLSGRS